MQNTVVSGIYANTQTLNGVQRLGNNTINRSSLMSTGSSEEGTSSGSASCGGSSLHSSSNEQTTDVASCTNSTTGEYIMQYPKCITQKIRIIVFPTMSTT